MPTDFRYPLRTLFRTPGFTLSAVLALALGIGANAAVFSVVYAVLLNPLPYADPSGLVRIYESNSAQGIERGDVSSGTFVDVRARSRLLEHVGGLHGARVGCSHSVTSPTCSTAHSFRPASFRCWALPPSWDELFARRPISAPLRRRCRSGD